MPKCRQSSPFVSCNILRNIANFPNCLRVPIQQIVKVLACATRRDRPVATVPASLPQFPDIASDDVLTSDLGTCRAPIAAGNISKRYNNNSGRRRLTQRSPTTIRVYTATDLYAIHMRTFRSIVHAEDTKLIKPLISKPITGCLTWFYSLNIMYWNHCCHPFSHRATTLENGRILDRFQTAVLI